MPSKLTVRGS